MAKYAGQKTKLLQIIRILEEHTDEAHPMPTKEIIRRLDENGVHAERKSIYDDIATLQDFGYDIIQVSNRNGGGYYLAARDFELAELKLLVDAVAASRFITTKKSRDLIKKLEGKAGKHDAGKLQRQVAVAGRAKTENERVFYSIDGVHNAIQENCKISFVYLEWNTQGKLLPRDSKVRVVSPWAMIFREDNYYLLAYDDADRIMKHYRVDKLDQVRILSEKRLGREEFEAMDIAVYVNQSFGMWSGENETVTLKFSNHLSGVVFDRFGKDVDVRPDEEQGYFRVRTGIRVSGQFFGWLCGLGKGVSIAAPETVRKQYLEWLKNSMEENS